MAKKRRLTILADPVDDKDIIEYFDNKPITDTGLKLIRAGMIIEEADLLDHFEMLRLKGMVDSIGALESVKKSLELYALFTPESKQKPPPESKNKSLTGFGSQK